jgi:hypothetical protein
MDAIQRRSNPEDNWQNGSLNDLRRERERVKIEQQKLELGKARGELVERKAVKKFLAERARMERDSWLAWASAVSARLAASFGIDHGRLFGAIEDEVRAQLRYLAKKPLEEGDHEERVEQQARSRTTDLRRV